jgi:hypothetical protein
MTVLNFKTLVIGLGSLLMVTVAHGKCYPGLDCPEDLPNANKTPSQQVPESTPIPIPNEQQPIEKIVGQKINDSSSVEARMGDTNVRKPTGDVEKFWGDLSWDDLSTDEKKLWSVLGWNGKLWAAGANAASAPASQNTDWNKLSDEEQAAARSLGYNKKSWNQE